MKSIRRAGVAAALLVCTLPWSLGAQNLADSHAMSIEPERTVKSEAFEWEHVVQVALPASYRHSGDRMYPTLWVTDGSLMFEAAVAAVQGLALGQASPEMIVVGVGAPRDTGFLEYSQRRSYEFSPNEEILYEGLGGDIMKRQAGPMIEQLEAGGAPKFLDFLVDELRPKLAREYRMDPADHGVFGLSGGGMFVGYALFARPGAFAKYLCGSPSLNGGNFEIFELEEKYAKENKDYDVKVFFGAGEVEVHQPGMAEWSIVGSMIRLAETLTLRRYPSLVVKTKIFPGEDHFSVAPLVLSWGIRELW